MFTGFGLYNNDLSNITTPKAAMKTTPSDEIDRELQQSMHDAGRGVPTAARRAAELLELLDRDSDAAVMWRFAAELGEPDAIAYVEEFVRGDTILPSAPNEPADVLDAVLARQREAVAGAVDPIWLDAAITEIQKVPICAIHNVPEPDKPGDYRSCVECQHVWRTEEDFVADVQRDRAEHAEAYRRYERAEPPPDTTDPRNQPFCPLCAHDF